MNKEKNRPQLRKTISSVNALLALIKELQVKGAAIITFGTNDSKPRHPAYPRLEMYVLWYDDSPFNMTKQDIEELGNKHHAYILNPHIYRARTHTTLTIWCSGQLLKHRKDIRDLRFDFEKETYEDVSFRLQAFLFDEALKDTMEV